MADYGINNIQVLEGLEAVRKRPGMYIGSTDSRGLHHLIWEIVDNSVDEYLAEVCTDIKITINKDDSISIEDNGRGIPVEPHPIKKLPGVRLIFTTLHAGGKFDSEGYKYSGGLHGVGSSVVNALSKWVEVTVYKNGKEYTDRYEDGGYPVTKLTTTGTLRGKSIDDKEKHGTKVTFLPDSEIFETTKWKPELIKQRLRELSYLNKGLRITFENQKNGDTEIFHKENGIVGYIEEFSESENLRGDIFSFEDIINDIKIEVAFSYMNEQSETIVSFCNNINTHEGGTHVAGFKSGIAKLVNYYVKELNTLKGNLLDPKDIRQGIIAVISIYHPDPQFEGQTKGKLGSTDAKAAVENVIYNKGQLFFDRNITLMNEIIENAIRAMNLRKKIDNTKQNYNTKELLLKTNGKLAGCNSKNPKECEIYIVEGE